MSPNNHPLTYSCNRPTLSNMDESETLTAVYGTHMSGKTNYDVGYLLIANAQGLTFLPKGIEHFFPNLIALRFDHSNISTLSGHELDAFNNLLWFMLGFQPQLERIPRNLFANTPLVHTIFLDNNNIKHVGENLLTSLPHLDWAFFGNNYCINQNVQNPSQMASLIEHLRSNCTDIEEPSTTTTTLSPTSTEEPSCGDIKDIICNLEEQNSILMQQNSEIKLQVDDLTVKNQEMAAHNEEMGAKIVEISSSLEDMAVKNAVMSAKFTQMLNEVLKGILELSIRPCG